MGGSKGGVEFGVSTVEGAPRAWMLCRGTKLYMYAIWEEEFTTNPLAWTKYVQGKFVCQKDPAVMEFCTLPYKIENGDVLKVGAANTEEGPYGPAVMPSDTIKDMEPL